MDGFIEIDWQEKQGFKPVHRQKYLVIRPVPNTNDWFEPQICWFDSHSEYYIPDDCYDFETYQENDKFIESNQESITHVAIFNFNKPY
ncbi:MAG: hypothetical protein GY827_04720 [Cytophagales bacterium]|nr:hypothetical protein [Cytophagales bacterium]